MIVQGAGHHVYADRASAFNNMVNQIASFVDKGQLPPKGENLLPKEQEQEEEDARNAFDKFLNVGRDHIRDESIKAEER